MSNLPCELLDHIVDLLDGNQTPLRNCCLVSKSWIPRTRKHLFAEIRFRTAKSLQSWKKTFPDPSTSPARYAGALFIGGPQGAAAADVEAGGWISGFSHVVRLEMVGLDIFARGWANTFALFHGFSPVVKSIRMDSLTFPPSPFFDLILSFPLLEDLTINNCYAGGSDGPSIVAQPLDLPIFTGSLALLRGGMGLIVQRLLSLPGGAHFRKLTLTWSHEEDISLTKALVEMCSHTLESLDIFCTSRGASAGRLRPHGSNSPFLVKPKSNLFNLQKVTELGDVVFRPGSLSVEWITLVLQAITREHRELQRISVIVPFSRWAGKDFGEGIFEQWSDLDHILAHLSESLSIRTNVRWERGHLWNGAAGNSAGCLFPEMRRRGMVTVDPEE